MFRCVVCLCGELTVSRLCHTGDSDSLLSGACISQWVASVCKKNSLGATLPSKSADGTIIVVVDTVAPYILRHSGKYDHQMGDA